MIKRIPIQVQLGAFEGPLDLLLYLIQIHELDVCKISISKITNQYLDVIRNIQALDFEVASDFLVMAATLTYWKSKALLPLDDVIDPQEEGIPESPEDLMHRLKMHALYLDLGGKLAQRPMLGEDVFARANRRPPTHKIWSAGHASNLAVLYQQLMVRSRKRTQVLQKETVSITDKIRTFEAWLPDIGSRATYQTLLAHFTSKPHQVATFLALLELSRLGRVLLHQSETYGPIYAELIQTLLEFDPSMATGFEDLEGQLNPVTEELRPTDVNL